MTALMLLLSIVALFCAIGASRQLIRTLCAWQKAMEAMLTELRERQTTTREPSPCPCTCHHPISSSVRGGYDGLSPR
jgi:hypothetical protein